jgi:PAS domain S-box-containing protein
MYILAKVTLENEMDLVLAHKRSMKLAELAGLSLSPQTSFATAVSEVARNTIEYGKNGCLILGISEDKKRSIVACIKDDNLKDPRSKEGLEYAKRLVNRLNISAEEGDNSIELYHYMPNGDKIDIHQIDRWRNMFRNELPISPYDEIKRKSEQLQELAEKIRESEDHYRMLTDTLPLMMFSLDQEGNLTYMNKWMQDYFGLSCEEINKNDRLELVHEEDRPLEKSLRNLVQKKEPIKGEWRLLHKEGSYFWHMVSIIPIIEEGNTHHWFGFLVDIHAQKLFEQTLKDNQELKEMQQQLQYHITQLNRSNEELQQFAYVASHDLQEPLRKLIFYSDYFQTHNSSQFDEKSTLFLKNMMEASHRMRTLIQELLAFSQVERKKLDIRKIDLGELMKEAIAEYDLLIKEKKAVVSVSSLPVIEGDPNMLRRLFENLLSNALKYSREVTPVINIRGILKNQMVQVEINDNGIGFEEHFLPKMFTLFQRLHGKDQYAGTGLGLAICLKIAEMHHGSITATSKVNEGSTFYVSLPIHQNLSSTP